jgi:uncharacterized protein YbjT (DUF2867 family)
MARKAQTGPESNPRLHLSRAAQQIAVSIAGRHCGTALGRGRPAVDRHRRATAPTIRRHDGPGRNAQQITRRLETLSPAFRSIMLRSAAAPPNGLQRPPFIKPKMTPVLEGIRTLTKEEHMNVIIFGATGMVGQSVLHASLMDPGVEQVLAVVRTSTGVRHPKLREVLLNDFAELTPIEDNLVGYDACFYCLGVSSVGLDEAAYTKVNYEYPVAAVRTLAKINADMTFIYVSGGGTNPNGRQMWARVKGRTENAVIETFRNGYAFRPGMVQPTFRATSKTNWFRTIYGLTAPIFPLLERVAPRYAITTDRLGHAMLRAARTGFPQHIVENRDIR